MRISSLVVTGCMEGKEETVKWKRQVGEAGNRMFTSKEDRTRVQVEKKKNVDSDVQKK